MDHHQIESWIAVSRLRRPEPTHRPPLPMEKKLLTQQRVEEADI